MTSKIDQGEIIYALREFLSHQTKLGMAESKIKHLIASHMPEVGTDFVIERHRRRKRGG